MVPIVQTEVKVTVTLKLPFTDAACAEGRTAANDASEAKPKVKIFFI